MLLTTNSLSLKKMDSQSSLSFSFSLELRLIKARNIHVSSSKEVFVRCYLSTASNKRVRIDSQEISSNSNNFIWNQTFSLNCYGSAETLNSVKKEAIVFELRCRSSAPFLAKISGSKLLARAEMAWNDVVGNPNMKSNEKWVVMTAKDKHVYTDDVKPPAIEIAMKVEENKKESGRKPYNCGCMDCGCNYCVDHDFLLL